MRNFIGFTFFIFSVHAFALTLIATHPCDKKLSRKIIVDSTKYESIGEMTIAEFKKAKIPFVGVKRGLNSLFHSPTGLSAIEVLSDFEMYAYGACFKLNGKIPKVYPDEIIPKQNDQIEWFIGAAHYRLGKWSSMCLSVQNRPFLCGAKN